MSTHADAGRKGAEVSNAKRAPSTKAAPQPQPCVCGCGGQTGGGSFLPGHDAKYKSALVRRALDGDETAIEVLAIRGWTKFLDKAREVASKPKSERKRETQARKATNAVEVSAMLAKMKQAAEVLREAGRYNGADKISISRRNVDDILSASPEEIRLWPSAAGAWAVGDRTDMMYQGSVCQAEIVDLRGERARIKLWASAGKPPIERTVDIASLGGEA